MVDGTPAWTRTAVLPDAHGAPARRAPQPPKGSGPKGRGKILIIIGAAVLAVILIAVLAVVRDNPRRAERQSSAGASTAGQQTNPPRARHHRKHQGPRMRSQRIYKPLPPVMRQLPCPMPRIRRPRVLC